MLDTLAPFHWTEANVALLRERYAAGVSAGRIADELGRGVTRNAVIRKIHRLGLTRDVTNVAGRARKDGVVRPPVVVKPRLKLRPQPEATPIASPKPSPLAIVRRHPPPLTCQPAPDDGLLIHELEFRHCRWPLLDLPAGNGDEMRYCGGRRVARKIGEIECPYCEEHARMAYAPTRSERQREGDERRRQALLRRRASERGQEERAA